MASRISCSSAIPASTVRPVDDVDRVARLEIQRIGHGQRDRVIVQGHGQAAELAQKAGRQRFDFGRDRGRAIEGQHRNLQLLGQRRQHVARGDEAQIHQDLAQLLAAALVLNFERAGEIVRSDQFPLDQDLAQAHRLLSVTTLVLGDANHGIQSSALGFEQLPLGRLHGHLDRHARWRLQT